MTNQSISDLIQEVLKKHQITLTQLTTLAQKSPLLKPSKDLIYYFGTPSHLEEILKRPNLSQQQVDTYCTLLIDLVARNAGDNIAFWSLVNCGYKLPMVAFSSHSVEQCSEFQAELALKLLDHVSPQFLKDWMWWTVYNSQDQHEWLDYTNLYPELYPQWSQSFARVYANDIDNWTPLTQPSSPFIREKEKDFQTLIDLLKFIQPTSALLNPSRRTLAILEDILSNAYAFCQEITKAKYPKTYQCRIERYHLLYFLSPLLDHQQYIISDKKSRHYNAYSYHSATTECETFIQHLSTELTGWLGNYHVGKLPNIKQLLTFTEEDILEFDQFSGYNQQN